MRTFNGLEIFTEQLTNSGQLDARYIIKNEVLGASGQADFGTQSKIKALSVGGVIAGGVANIITGNYAAIGGGENNIAGRYAFVGGGINNQAKDEFSVVGGGIENIAGSDNSFIGAGCCNFINIRPNGSHNSPSSKSSIINGTSNIIDGNWSFIGGGLENLITGAGLFAFNNILGGWCNSIRASQMSTILGGRMNIVSGQNLAQATPDFIGGGCLNKAYNHGNFIGGGQNNITNCYGTILNGSDNTVCDSYASIILGGAGNLVSGYNGEEVDPDFIGGGCLNKAYNHGNFIGGGFGNIANSYGIIVGGSYNYAEGGGVIIGGGSNYTIYGSFIGNGSENLISGGNSFIGAGNENQIQSTDSIYSFIGGGSNNKIKGRYSFIGGGMSNEARANHSYIIGGRCSIVNASHCGAAVFGDGQDRIHNSSGPHTLTLDFDSGVYVSEIKKGPKDYLRIGQSNGILEFSSDNFINLIRDGTTVLSTEDASMQGWYIFNSNINMKDNDFYAPTGTIPSSNYPGLQGSIKFDKNYLYYCKENNKWIRTALSEW